MFELSILLPAFTFCVLAMSIGWAVAWKYQRIDIIDIIWSSLITLVSAYFAAATDNVNWRSGVVWSLLAFWCVRLIAHLVQRIATRPEDKRYGDLRKNYAAKAKQKYLTNVFLPQSVLAFVQSLPVAAALVTSQTWRVIDFFGIGIFVVALIGESISDSQLRHWRSEESNKNKTCREGLWKYSRHPNYFFEFVMWCSFVPLSSGGAYWYIGLLGPVIMYVLLVHLTGIPPIEKSALRKRPDDYRAYQVETNAFFPGPRKQSESSREG